MAFLYAITWVLYVIGVFWVLWWLKYVTVESAKWALSAQVQATAAIFGLLIAAVSLRWSRVTEQEQQLRSKIYSYLQFLAGSTKGIPAVSVLDSAYGKYVEWVEGNKKNKVNKAIFVKLGRFWVIKNLSDQYRLRLIFGRFLTVGQTKPLNRISKLSRRAAVDMWEDYHKRPEAFILNMHETFSFLVAIMIAEQPNTGEECEFPAESVLLDNIASSIISDNSKLIAEEVKRTRIIIRPRFYLTAFLLALAILLGLSILTGIEGTLYPFSLIPNYLAWAVGIPIGLSFAGIIFSLLIIRKII